MSECVHIHIRSPPIAREGDAHVSLSASWTQAERSTPDPEAFKFVEDYRDKACCPEDIYHFYDILRHI